MGMRVVILGAGVCGLATAWRLLESDPTLDVTLVEREERPGGLARSLTVDGQVTDLGPHRIYTELADVKAFLRDLVGDELETVRRVSRMWLKGGWIDYPPRPAQIVPHLGVLRVADAGISYLANKASSLFQSNGRSEDSFESLMVDAFGPDLYRLLVGPYARKVWKTAPSRLHGDVARVRVSAGGLDQIVKKLVVGEPKDKPTAVKEFFYIAGGVENLVRKLRAGVEERGGKIRVVREVVSLHPFAKGPFRVGIIDRETGKRESLVADRVVSTIPVSDLLRMLLAQRPDEEVAKVRGQLRYLANFLVGVIVRRPRVTDAQWLYFPGKDTVFNRGYEPKNFHESMGDDGRSLLVLEITCHRNDETWNRSDEELTRATLRGLERTGLVDPAEIDRTFVHRIPFTYPFYDLAYRRRLRTVLRYLEGFPGLLSVGRQGLFLHNNMDHSIHMGFRAAEAVVGTGRSRLAPRFYHDVPRFQQFRIVD